MAHITTDDEWVFEVKTVRAIKVQRYGKPYNAIAYMEIVNGELSVESLLSKEDFTIRDFKTLERHVTRLGFSEYKLSRFENGERVIRKRVIK
jgi:hypothetical protein